MEGVRRLLVIDASINKRVATDLKRRGRNAISAAQLGIHRKKDPFVLRFLHLHCPGAVLVAYDDHLPKDHADLVDRWRSTVAIIDPKRDSAFSEEQWKFEIAHRWGHKIEDQQPHSIMRYGLGGGRKWTRPRRLRAPTPPIARPSRSRPVKPSNSSDASQPTDGQGSFEL